MSETDRTPGGDLGTELTEIWSRVVPAAARVLEEVLTDPNADTGHRLAAAKLALDMFASVARSNERLLQERVASVEQLAREAARVATAVGETVWGEKRGCDA